MENNDRPVSAQEFEQLMSDIGLGSPGPPVAVAVSGGADSLALTLLASDWGHATGLVFDHGLRPGSGKEAQRVGVWLDKAGVGCVLLEWSGDKPGSDLQAAARTARYKALEGWCRENDVEHLLLGHHLDDQAETFLIRLARGSGVDGLSAMAALVPPLTRPDGPRICRPLLSIPKARLEATLRARDQEWIEDPSNQDPAFLRNQVRRFLKDTDIEGLSAQRLSDTAARMTSVRDFLDQVTDDYLRLTARFDPGGYVEVAKDFGQAIHPVIGLRALARILKLTAGADYQPRQARLERLYDDLGRRDFPGATLGGCQLVADLRGPTPALLVIRESAAVTEVCNLEPGQTVFWDSRFLIEYVKGDGVLTLKALGEAGWRQLVAEMPEGEEIWFPKLAALCLPSFWQDETLVAVPQLGYRRWDRLEISVRTGAERWRWEESGEFT
jgi:tRNA(Ile)-lysidine synthase